MCDELITCKEESYGCLSVLSVVCSDVDCWLRADHFYRGVL